VPDHGHERPEEGLSLRQVPQAGDGERDRHVQPGLRVRVLAPRQSITERRRSPLPDARERREDVGGGIDAETGVEHQVDVLPQRPLAGLVERLEDDPDQVLLVQAERLSSGPAMSSPPPRGSRSAWWRISASVLTLAYLTRV